jgi:hypothetical protein
LETSRDCLNSNESFQSYRGDSNILFSDAPRDDMLFLTRGNGADEDSQ